MAVAMAALTADVEGAVHLSVTVFGPAEVDMVRGDATARFTI
jgi:hypothetical protein